MKTRFTLTCALGLAAASIAAARAQETDRAPPLVIKGARIVVAAERIVEGGSILFEDGLIAAVGTFDHPVDAVVIEGAGLVVYPGFIDAASPLGLDKWKPRDEDKARDGHPRPLKDEPPIRMADANRKGVRAFLDASRALAPDKTLIAAERAGGFTAVLATPNVGLLAGTSALVAASDRPRREAVLRSPVFLHASLEPPAEQGYPTTLIGALAMLRQAFADADQLTALQARAARGRLDGRPPSDPDLEVIARARARELPVAFSAESDRDVERCLDLARDEKLSAAIVGGSRATRLAARLRSEATPLVVSLTWPPEPKAVALEDAKGEKKPRRGRVRGPFRLVPGRAPTLVAPAAIRRKLELVPEKGADGLSLSPGVLQILRKERREQVEALARWWHAGVRPLAVTSRGLEKPSLVLARLREAIEAGLPEEAALEVLTTGPAALVGMSRELGTLEPGKIAHATVLSGRLSDKDVKVRFVIVDGVRHDVDKDEGPAAGVKSGPPGSPAGAWRVETEYVKGTLVLALEGTALSGSFVVEGGGKAEVTGTFENGKLSMTGTLGRTRVTFEGSVSGDEMSGTAKMARGPEAAFTARRVPK